MIKAFKISSLSFIFIILCPFLVNADEGTSDERLAAQYFRDGQYEEAAAIYEELFDESASDVIYNNYLKSLFELEEYRQAERVVKKQIDYNPEQTRYEVDLGYIMIETGNTRRGNRHLNRLIDNLPNFPRGVINLAEAFLNRDMTDRALEVYKEGRKEFGSSHPFNIQIARIYEQQRDFENMMSEYIDLVADNYGRMQEVKGLLQDILEYDPEFKKNDALRRVLLQRSQRVGASNIYSEMLLWLSIQQKDFAMALRQARALDRRLQKEGEIIIEVADLSLNNKNFDVAEQAYDHVINIGKQGMFYHDARIGLLDVKYQRLISSYNYDLDELMEIENAYKEALEEFGVHPHSVTIIRNLANIKAFYLGKSEEAVKLLETVINMPRVYQRVKAECRIEMADILLLNGKVWEAKLLYSRVDKSFRDDPVGYEARFKNARLSFYMREFDWAKAQLDILKSATSKLIANDAMALSMKIQDNIDFDGDTEPLEMYARAERMTFMNRFEEALAILDSINHRFPTHPINDDLVFSKAEINLSTGNYSEADSLLQELTRNYPRSIYADQALFKRAEINENILVQKDIAQQLYRQIMIDYPASIYSHTARNRYRSLREDLVN